MFFKHFLFFFTTLLICSVYRTTQVNNDGAVIISLKDYNENKNIAQVFNTTTTLKPGETIEIDITNVNRLVRYFIIQAHTFHINVSLSFNNIFTKNKTVSGTNIGLVQMVEELITYKFYIKNENTQYNNTVLLLIATYPDNVPIPGGCNMEYMVETAPYQQLKYNDDIVTVDAQAASVEGFICTGYEVSYKMYHMYLPEINYSPENYFTALQKMVTPEEIEKNGKEIHKIIPNKHLRRLYSSYRGTGTVYAVIAYHEEGKAAYVPITTYACNPLYGNYSCDSPKNHFTKFLCGSIFFLGLFMCFWGHRYFKTEMFVIGALLGSYLSYIGLFYANVLNEEDTLITSISIGILFGLSWLMFWWFFGIPVLSIFLVLLVFGFTVASVAFYAGLDDINIFESDLNYWGFLVCIAFLTVTVTIGFTHQANMLACSILGAYAVVIPIDHYIGSNIKYIFINVLRRATVENFEYAVLDPPFQFRDAILVGVLVTLATVGMIVQTVQQKGRPPFPPSPYQTEQIQQLSERTPLLVHQQYVPRQASNTAPTAPNYRLIA